MQKFRRVSTKRKQYRTPLDLFPDIRPRKIAAPYDHQAQLLRDYSQKAVKERDVAIQGATGSGKTLVGLLIAEWRRRQLNERPVYLCPTRQLVHQVATFAKQQMGLPARAFVGSKSAFPASDQAEWRGGESIAITTYSALFNVNPFFNRPNFIIVDDAHAADQYIADYWTVRVVKDDDKQAEIFEEIASILRAVLPADEAARMAEEPRSLSDYMWVQVVPAPLIWKHETEITGVLDQAENGSDLAFRWSVIKGHLRACQVYISPHELVIRPVLPPTADHEPFTTASQRLYMSATLGRGGELERLAGRNPILRLPSPEGWNGHGVGRRFFMFPGASLDADASNDLVAKLVKQTGRALYLAADDKGARRARAFFAANLSQYEIISARQIEESKKVFTSEKKAIALIANRYDGIDFPNDECRLLIVEGRPAGASLQEKFLANKLGARALFSERIRTRVIQAFGRCTRSANDYALVIAAGSQLLDELTLRENTSLLDRELQAEIRFGHEQSQNLKENDFLSLASLFLEQSDDWRDAERDIVNLRDEMKQEVPRSLPALDAAAICEIEYMTELWRGSYADALDAAQKVVTSLAGGEELKGYRAWWQYLAGCAALLDAEERGTSRKKADEHFRLARGIGGIRWLSGLVTSDPKDKEGAPPEDEAAVEAIEAQLHELGITKEGPFTEKVTSIRKGIAGNEAKSFEAARKELGELLGFQTGNSGQQGAPDPWWISGESLCIVFEDHSNGKPGNALSIEKARQAASHVTWIEENVVGLKKGATTLPVLITAADTSRDEVRTHLRSVVVWPLDDFRAWADQALGAIRKVRARLSTRGDLAWRADALTVLSSIHATPSSLASFLSERLRAGAVRKR